MIRWNFHSKYASENVWIPADSGTVRSELIHRSFWRNLINIPTRTYFDERESDVLPLGLQPNDCAPSFPHSYSTWYYFKNCAKNLQVIARRFFILLVVLGECGLGGGEAGHRCNNGDGSLRTRLTQCLVSTILSMEAERGKFPASKSSSSPSLQANWNHRYTYACTYLLVPKNSKPLKWKTSKCFPSWTYLEIGTH